MDLRFNDEQKMIRDSARGFLEARCTRKRLDEIDADPRGHSDLLWSEMAGLGWMGLHLPERFGGSSLGLRELCIVIEELGRASLSGPYLGTAVCAHAISRFGSEEQKSALLPPVVAGRSVLTLARCDPQDPWAPTGTGVTAHPCDDGYLLRGASHFVPNADLADRMLVLARLAGTDGEGLSIFIVEGGGPGVRKQGLEVVGGERQCLVRFEDCRVAPSDGLGAAGEAAAVLRSIDEWSLAARCAEMIGGAQRVLEMAAGYAQQRHAFGKPIGSFQAIQHHCANMAMSVLSARLMTDEAIHRLERGEPDAAESACVAKAWVGDAYRNVCKLGHQVHGAIGFTWEHDLQRYSRHAMAAELAHGDSLWHLDRIAASLGL